MEKENMKKVFMIMIVAVLLTSMVGGVVAAGQTVNNSSVMAQDGVYTFPHTVTVTLNLENDYIVTIPDDFVIKPSRQAVGSTGEVNVYVTDENNPPRLEFEVTLLEKNAMLNVSVKSSQYNSSYNSGVGGLEGAWRLNATDGSSLHYLMALGTAHIKATNDYDSNGKLPVSIGVGGQSKFIDNTSVAYSTTITEKVNLHAMVIEHPEHVATYTDQLTFIVEYEQSA